MEYDSTFINRNFRLKVNGRDRENRYINKLVGVSGLLELLEPELVNKIIRRAITNKKDKTKCCFRRGLRVTLYIK
jgi:hypothetical protein